MKVIIQKTAPLTMGCILVMIALFSSCHKDKQEMNSDTTAHQSNRPPVANAGPDITVNIGYCYFNRSAELDGSASSDPDDYKIYYLWSQISGPSSCFLSDNTSPKAHISNLSAGQYAFELKVTDKEGLFSKDTVNIAVTGSALPTEYNLDVIINSNYTFIDSIEYIDIFGSGYYDLTTIESRCNLSSLGQFNFYTYEEADTDTSGNNHNTEMRLSNSNGNSQNVSGTSSINFKRLIQQGGGPFNGTWKIETGSATNCDQNIFANLNPLTVTGSLDTTAHIVNLTIKGKVYF